MHRHVEDQPSKKTKNNGDKSAVAILQDTRQLGCEKQDIEPPESSSILRKSAKVLRPIRRVQFSNATLRHANIRERKGPSLGIICPADPAELSPYAPKFEDRSKDETEGQERCARGDAWLAKGILKLKENNKSIFLTYRELVCLPTPSVAKLEEREFVVDPGASMQMLSRNSAELETVRVSKSPTTVVTANGEVKTSETASVYVK